MTSSTERFDLVVIGGGSGGVRAARIAATHGARVAIIERAQWGGTCVVRGCIPKKLFVYAAQAREAVTHAAAFGHHVAYGGHDWSALRAAVAGEVARLSALYRANLERVGVTLIEGHATCLDPHTVAVGARRLTASKILLAVGGRPRRLEVPGGEHAAVSDAFFTLPAMPRRAVILGAGYIATEFASVLAALGGDVTMVVRGRPAQALPGFDHAIGERVVAGLMRRGVRIRWQTEVVRIDSRGPDGYAVRLRGQDGAEDSLDSDWVCAAIGRQPELEGLGLEALGIACGDQGEVLVDQWSRTNVPSVFAVGDCTGRVPLTPAAIREGHAFADTQFGQIPRPITYDAVVSAVFSLPQAAGAGLTEAAARERFGDQIAVYETEFRSLGRALEPASQEVDRTFMKLVTLGDGERIIGAHMVGDGAAEIIQMAAVAVTAGLNKAAFDATMALHPTVAEEFVLLKTKRF